MAFCNHCGQQIPDNANACPYCGTFVGGQNTQQAAPQQVAQPVDPQQNFQQAAQPIDPQQNYQQNYQQSYQQSYQQAPQQNFQPGYGAPQQGYAQPYVTPEMDVQQSKGIAWLSYMGLLFLIPMFVKKYSDYTRFHVKQGVTLCAVELTHIIVFSIILAIIPQYTYGYYYTIQINPLYTIFNVLYVIGIIALQVFAIIGIVNAATGKRKELPLFGKIPWVATLLDKTVYK